MSGRARRAILGTLVGLSAWTVQADSALGLSCATPPNGAELAITSGWPEAAPLDYVVIATIRDIQPVNGDSGTWGEVLVVRVDAVLRGDLSLSTTEIFNPPLGSPGWPWFTAGGQFLIGAHASSEGTGGRISTNLCAPNEEIASPDRFHELVALSAEPRLSNTAMPRPGSFPTWGLGLVVLGCAITIAARRSMGGRDNVH